MSYSNTLQTQHKLLNHFSERIYRYSFILIKFVHRFPCFFCLLKMCSKKEYLIQLKIRCNKLGVYNVHTIRHIAFICFLFKLAYVSYELKYKRYLTLFTSKYNGIFIFSVSKISTTKIPKRKALKSI